MKAPSSKILEQADLVLAASKSLDYQRILQHDRAEIAKLNAVLTNLKIGDSGVDGLGNYASEQTKSKPRQQKPLDSGESDSTARERVEAEVVERRAAILSQLSDEGLSDRINQVYNSFASSRRMTFKQLPHRRGIPNFDFVIAPDFAPVPGLHGVFISAEKIMSVVLPSDQSDADWQILKEKAYSNHEEMIEYITLIATGFDLP